jgi:hypothetical protein
LSRLLCEDEPSELAVIAVGQTSRRKRRKRRRQGRVGDASSVCRAHIWEAAQKRRRSDSILKTGLKNDN